jgi:hypothetical protein
MSKIGDYLGLNIDLLAKSQMFFGYKDRSVLSELESSPFPASELIKTIDFVPPVVKQVTSSKKNEIYEDRFNYFKYAYEAQGKTKSAYLFRLMRHTHDLGFTFEENDNIIRDVVDYHGNDINYIYKRTGLDRQLRRLYGK